MQVYDIKILVKLTVFDGKIDAVKAPSYKFTTKNISAAGVFLLTNRPLGVGTRVEIRWSFSVDVGPGKNSRSAQVRIKGTVVNVEPDGMAVRFASKYQIIPLDKPSDLFG